MYRISCENDFVNKKNSFEKEIKLRKNILSVSNQRHFLGGPNVTQTKRKKIFSFIESNNYVLSVQIKNKN
jgi:glutamine amidotransferase PdxT